MKALTKLSIWTAALFIVVVTNASICHAGSNVSPYGTYAAVGTGIGAGAGAALGAVSFYNFNQILCDGAKCTSSGKAALLGAGIGAAMGAGAGLIVGLLTGVVVNFADSNQTSTAVARTELNDTDFREPETKFTPEISPTVDGGFVAGFTLNF